MRSAAPVANSVEASRQTTVELAQVADRIGTAQRDMAVMAKAVAELSEKVGAVWDNYRNRFEKIDGELQAVFERLQGGTRAFGEEFTDFVGKLDTSLANGMQAFSLGTEELREVAEMLVVSVNAKAA
jgi:phage host-nuclease inhibitor protein Gam